MSWKSLRNTDCEQKSDSFSKQLKHLAAVRYVREEVAQHFLDTPS